MAALIKPTGFREYDARWWFGHPDSNEAAELNLSGVTALGMGLGTLIHELGVGPEIVVGHDYRSYSSNVKNALIEGLVAVGCCVTDIGLSLSPTAYFAQFDLDIASVAMVTASHNENGWTGVKMGANRPLTFGPDEMARLRDIVVNKKWKMREGGLIKIINDFAERYIGDLINRPKFTRKIKAIVACGNGTAGAFAPKVLEALGVEVIKMDCVLDHSFPNYNPNPEDIKMLNAMSKRVLQSDADIAFGFDGDGDRCGVVDNTGVEIFADIVGLMLARDISKIYDNKQFVVDVKSTGLFKTDPVLLSQGAKTDYYKTGHSYIKQRVNELNAIAGFEKSGHFFFNDSLGRGYDDGLLSAISICDMLERNPKKSIAQLRADLPMTYALPTLSTYCADENKYDVMHKIAEEIDIFFDTGKTFGVQKLANLNSINGVRFTSQDGTWGLIRASSNEPKLVIVIESPISTLRRDEMLDAVRALLEKYPQVGKL